MLCIYKTYVVLLNFHLAFNEVGYKFIKEKGEKKKLPETLARLVPFQSMLLYSVQISEISYTNMAN